MLIDDGPYKKCQNYSSYSSLRLDFFNKFKDF